MATVAHDLSSERERERERGREGGRREERLERIVCTHIHMSLQMSSLLPFSPPLITGQKTAAGKEVHLACGEVCGGDTKVFQRVEGTSAHCSSYIMPTSFSAHSLSCSFPPLPRGTMRGWYTPM